MSTSSQSSHEELTRHRARPGAPGRSDGADLAGSGRLGGPGRPGDPRDLGAGVLDNPAWTALTGPHRHLAELHGGAARYRTDVAPFVALAYPADPRCWTDVAELVGPGNPFTVAGLPEPPDSRPADQTLPGRQFVATALDDGLDPEAVPLGPADVPEMLDLVERCRPGPFLPRTIDMGAYVGIRRGGRLVAMAGERMRPPGWTEISAVCTDEAYRGQGLAVRLIRHVATGIHDRGDTPFLHAASTNTGAIRLYESIGFTERSPTLFRFFRVPADALEGRA